MFLVSNFKIIVIPSYKNFQLMKSSFAFKIDADEFEYLSISNSGACLKQPMVQKVYLYEGAVYLISTTHKCNKSISGL
jgi:hypothetical protein